MLAERKQQVMSKVEQLTVRARELWGPDVVPQNLKVYFDLRGRTAGQACRRNGQFYMRFNVDMMQNDSWDHLINNTVPHELAHIVCMWKVWDRAHGRRWQAVCRSLGGDGERCHKEEVRYAKGSTYLYTTSTGKTIAISQVRHRKIQRGVVYRTVDGGKIDSTCTYKIAA